MSTVEIPADLGIEAAEPLQATLRETLSSKATIELDASQVNRLHAASLEVLAALFMQRNAAGLKTQLQKPSDEFKAAARISGLSSLFGLSNP